MKLLLMNLSHYWRRPALILLQLFCLCMFLVLVIASQNINMWTPCLCSIAMIGGIIYAYQTEILSRPFSFTLPGHRRVFRRLMFLVNAFWLLAAAILILLFWPQNLLHRVYGCILTVTGGNLAFWRGTRVTDKTRPPKAMTGLIVPVILFVPMLTNASIVEGVLFNPAVIIAIAAVSGIVTFRMWRNLGQLSLFASYCGLQSVGMFSVSNQKNLQKLKRQQFAVGAGEGAEDFIAGVETFFLKRIERTRHKPVASFVYGVIYQDMGPTLQCQLRSRGWSIIWMFLLFGYYGKIGDFIIWIIFLFPLFWTDLQVHSTLLVTRGRTQRYIMAMSWLLFPTITALGFIFICLGLTKIVEPFMPAIHLRSLNATFHAPDWQLWYIFAAGVPLIALLRLLFWNKFVWFFCAVIIFGIMGAMFPIINHTDLHMQIWSGWIALILIIAWAAFAAYLYRVCFHQSLSGQK